MKLLNRFVKFGIPVIGLILISSCGSSSLPVIPRAINTVAPVTFNDLNLKSEDYTLLNTSKAVATVQAKYSKNKVEISTDGFTIKYNIKNGIWLFDKCEGVATIGYLKNIATQSSAYIFPEELARRIAIYRLINNVKMDDADGVIEPVVSTNVSTTGKNTVTYVSTAQGKLIKLKSKK